VVRKIRGTYLANLRDARLDWSGRGQHVVFDSDEQLPLQHLQYVGHGATGDVYKVLCRRFALAQKNFWIRKWNLDECMREVLHLQKFRHLHIVRLVGTYVQGKYSRYSYTRLLITTSLTSSR
jgi:hypothetical protein